MPTYQYVCTECGEPLEVVQKFSDDPLTVCPACQGRLRKVFSPVGVVFKGSGFYKTDSRSSSSSASPSKSDSKTSERKTETTPDTKSESKPDTKSESKPSTSSGRAGTKVAYPSTSSLRALPPR